MRKSFSIIVILCILCLTGCKDGRTYDNGDMTDVVVIQNTTCETVTTRQNIAGDVETLETTGDAAYTFVEDLDYDVKAFIRQYYDYLADGEFELAEYMTNDSSKMDRELFMHQSEYIEEVKNLTCYMMEGMTDGTYIVVARCDVLTTLGAYLVTMLDAFYICTNESGTIYICGGGLADEVKSYNSIMLSSQIITDIVSEVAEENAEAVEDTEQLAELYGVVYTDGITGFLYEQSASQ